MQAPLVINSNGRNMFTEKVMQAYFVTIRTRTTDYRRELRFMADDFAHAEEQAIPYVIAGEDIVRIELDYKS